MHITHGMKLLKKRTLMRIYYTGKLGQMRMVPPDVTLAVLESVYQVTKRHHTASSAQLVKR